MRLTPVWADRVLNRLDRRLSGRATHPVAVAVSGGSDSTALMRLATQWACRRQRRLLVLSVDHGLNPQGADWNARVARLARTLNVDWRGLSWTGPAPNTGLQAAARRARHALLADAAREAGARVILMAHTADDVAEADWMRSQGAPLGRLRDWSPSPVWPEGRGVMLLRPLLDVSRTDLRHWLTQQGTDWIDDPANADPRFLRTHARAASIPRHIRAEMDPPPAADLDCESETGVITGPINTAWLGPALACASGREAVASATSLARLRDRLQVEGVSCLAGALITVAGGRLTIVREPGRRPPTDRAVPIGEDMVWDGRFLVKTSASGWSVGPAAGRRSRLSDGDRTWLNQRDPPARGVHPVLLRSADARPVLADPSVETACLVGGRLRLACGQARTEDDL